MSPRWVARLSVIGSKASIAKLLGVHVQTLYSFVKKYNMKKNDLS